MHYYTLYDVSQQSLQWWWPIIGVLMIATGLFLKMPRYAEKQRFRRASEQLLIIGVGFTFIACMLVYAITSRNSSVLLESDTKVVEGQVENFIPGRYERGSMESFTVAGVHFTYADSLIEGGFNQTVANGGPIREGMQVRIHYLRGVILKLEAVSDR